MLKIKKTGLVISIGLAILLSGCGGSGGSIPSVEEPTNSTTLSIYPSPLVIPENGNIELTAVLKDKNNEIIENTDENNLTITWSSADSSCVSVDEIGTATGKSLCSTKVTATIKNNKNNETYTKTIDADVKFVNVSKLFINPSISTMKQGVKKNFMVTALNKTSDLTIIESAKLSFSTEGNYVKATKNVTDVKSEVQVEALELLGYDFVTPIYTESGVQVTGKPLFVQIQANPQPNPVDNAFAGEHIDFVLEGRDSNQELFMVHCDSAKPAIYFQHLSGGIWNRVELTLPTGTTRIEYTKLIKDGDNLWITAYSGSDVIAWVSEDKGASWIKGTIASNISMSKNLVDIAVSGNNKYVVYFNENDNNLSLANINTFSDINTTVIKSGVEVDSFDIALNNSGELRMALKEKDGNSFYISYQNSKFYKEVVADNGSSKPTITFNRFNNPYVVYYLSAQNQVVLSKRTSMGWNANSISETTLNDSGIKFVSSLANVKDIDVKFDSFNAARILILDDTNLYYAKQYEQNNQVSWRVDQLETQNVGDYVAMDLDSANRVKVFYQDSSVKWPQYWNEPIFFDYREKAPRVSTTDDKISENSSNEF